MKIAVYGAGGVGAYFGGRLAMAGADVHMIARGDHLKALKNEGLSVESIHGDFDTNVPATDDPADVGECDYVLVCVKSYDTEEVADQLAPMIGSNTTVISLQNGVNNEEILAEAIGREHVVGGVAYIFSTISQPGFITHTDGPARIIFGELDGTKSDRTTSFLEICERAEGMEGTLSTNIFSDLWKKYVFICAQSGVTATTRLSIGDIREVKEPWTLFQYLLEEGVAVASAEGIELPEDTVTEWVEFAQNLEADASSSLHYDMTRGNRMELEALHGALVKKANEHNVSAPRSRTIYAILRPWALKNAQL